MPLPLAATQLGSTAGLYSLIAWGGAGAVVLAMRKWAAGYRCPSIEEGELAGKTYILVGAFSSTGLSVFHTLAAHNCQVIALHPDPLSPPIVQLLLLLRSSSGNDRLYAEECDITSIASIRAFVGRWQKDARAGMVQDLEARVDGIIFCDGDGAGKEALPFGIPAQWTEETGAEKVEQYRMSHLTGRHALVQLLLPTMLRSAATSTSPVRIVNCVNPFYSAVAPGSFSPSSIDCRPSSSPSLAPAVPPRSAFPSKAPWIVMGRVSVASILLWQEFQRRLTSSASAASSPQPPSASNVPSAAAPTTTPILALSVAPGITRSALRSIFRASPSSPHFSYIGLLLYLVLFPLIWVFAKSAGEAGEVVAGALVGDVEGKEKKGGRGKKAKGEEGGKGEKGYRRAGTEEDQDGRMVVRGGALYREGMEVRLPLLAFLPPTTAAEVWDNESKLVERLLTAVFEEEKQKKGKEGGEDKEEQGKKDR
ncbi:hypothetical protein JCM11251_002882 [Rhodosporidiobolus azoricus]